MSNHDTSRLDLLALKVRAGLPLSPEDQALWDRGASLPNKVAAGLPLTDAERDQWEHLKNVRVVVKTDGVIQVEDGAAPKTTEDWKRLVAASRATPRKLLADAGTDKPQT